MDRLYRREKTSQGRTTPWRRHVQFLASVETFRRGNYYPLNTKCVPEDAWKPGWMSRLLQHNCRNFPGEVPYSSNCGTPSTCRRFRLIGLKRYFLSASASSCFPGRCSAPQNEIEQHFLLSLFCRNFASVFERFRTLLEVNKIKWEWNGYLNIFNIKIKYLIFKREMYAIYNLSFTYILIIDYWI